MWRIILLTICVITWFGLAHVQTQAATSITISQADKIHTYTLRRNTTLNSVLRTSPAFIIFEHADKLFVPVLRRAPSNLQTIYSALQARIVIQHADAQFVPVLVPIILDNGVPIGTVARNIAVGTPTTVIQARQQLTATPTTVPTDVPPPATTVADEDTPMSTVVVESTPAPSDTPTVIP